MRFMFQKLFRNAENSWNLWRCLRLVLPSPSGLHLACVKYINPAPPNNALNVTRLTSWIMFQSEGPPPHLCSFRIRPWRLADTSRKEILSGWLFDPIHYTIWLWLTVCHGKSQFWIGKPSINGPFSMAMLNNQRVHAKCCSFVRRLFVLHTAHVVFWCQALVS